MLVAGRSPDGRIQPVADTYFCKCAEAGGALAVIFPNRAYQADHTLLDEVVAVPSGKIEGPGQLTHQAVIPLDQYLFRVPVSPARQIGKRFIRQGSICGHLGFVDRHDYYTYFPLGLSSKY